MIIAAATTMEFIPAGDILPDDDPVYEAGCALTWDPVLPFEIELSVSVSDGTVIHWKLDRGIFVLGGGEFDFRASIDESGRRVLLLSSHEGKSLARFPDVETVNGFVRDVLDASPIGEERFDLEKTGKR